MQISPRPLEFLRREAPELPQLDRNLRAGLHPDAPNLRPGWKLLTPVAKLSAPLLMFLKMDDLSLKKKKKISVSYILCERTFFQIDANTYI